MTSDFRELRVWQAAMTLAESVYAITRNFPADERYGLTSQLRRAAVSVASCIAEGNARNSTKDYARFLSMASGSLAEVETQVLLAARLGYTSPQAGDAFMEELRTTAKQLQALKNSIAARLAIDTPFPVPRSPFPA
jgi:four helix bundle protein